MSWNISQHTTKKGETPEAPYSAAGINAPTRGEYGSEESVAAARAALAAAYGIVESGVFGAHDVLVNVNGHANPNATADDGYVHDHIVITLEARES